MAKYRCGALTLMEDGYCVRCGIKHTSRDLVPTNATPTVRKVAPVVEIKPEPVVFPKFELKFSTPAQEPKPEPKPKVTKDRASLKKLIRQTLDELSDRYGVDRFQVTFTSGMGAAHHVRKDWDGNVIKEWFTFGIPAMQFVYEYGYNDYATVARAIGYTQHSAKGADAVMQFIYHEFAHVLQCMVPGGRTKGSVHNYVFVREYKRVMKDAGYNWKRA